MGFTLKPAVKENFINREDLLKEMVTTLTDESIDMGFALIGSRRVGKTSILLEVANRLKDNENIVVVYFSVWNLVESTLKEFSDQLIQTILTAFKNKLPTKYKIKGLLKDKIKEILREAGFSIKILDEIEIELSRKNKVLDANILLEKIFGLTEELSKEARVRTILILEEFPALVDVTNGKKLGEGVIRKIRTVNERLEHTILCVSGSIRKTMEMAVLSPSSAFYRQFIIKMIEPFDKTTTGELLVTNLRQKIEPQAVEVAHSLTSGIPFYLQLLGRQLQGVATEVIEPETVKAVFEDILEEEVTIIFEEEFYRLSDKERAALRVMVEYEVGKLNDISKNLGEGVNVVSKYLEYLITKGLIQKETRGIYQIADPVFEQWLKKRFR
ncbi:MAG: ATP-binding protein [bacterium]|nr:ATP-binding protein [bacterium]